MWREVKRMSLKFEFAGEGRLSLALDSRLWAALIKRVYCKVHAGSRYIFTIAHDLMHLLMSELWHWINDKQSVIGWFDPYVAKMSQSGYRMRAVAFSEKLHVRFLRLDERIKVSADIFRTASPRHQDRGSGDADSHNDNFKKERLINFCGCGKQRSIIDRLSLYTRRSSTHAGRRNSGFLRCFDAALL